MRKYVIIVLHCIKRKIVKLLIFLMVLNVLNLMANKSSNNLLVVDLYFFNDYYNEIKATTLTMLFLNLLNFETIIVGLNANKAFNILINFIKKTLRTRKSKIL